MPPRPAYPTDHQPVLEVRPAAGRFDDVTTMVGTRKPGAGACWCMAYRDGTQDKTERPASMARICGAEPGPGILLYVDGEVAGWCSIAPRSTYGRLMRSRTIPQLTGDDPWVAVCFVVRAGFRGHGLMHHLLEGAVAHARAHGATAVEGYPVETDGTHVDKISGYVGTSTLFARAGFTRAGDTTAHSGGRSRCIMRLEL